MTTTLVRDAARATARVTARSWRDRVSRTAGDGTARLTGRSLLVLAPHPDDETFGCGALIARARAAGHAVTVAVATDGSRSTRSDRLTPAEIAALRRAELHDACARLGTTDVVELGYADGTLAAHGPALTAAVTELVRSRRPGLVLAPCPQDQHPDHQAVHRAAAAAAGPRLAGYPVWTWHSAPFFGDAPRGSRARLWRWAARQTVASSWLRVPAGPYLAPKRDAVGSYLTQTTNYTGEPGWSHLPPHFVDLFLGPGELFLPYP